MTLSLTSLDDSESGGFLGTDSTSMLGCIYIGM